MAITLADILRVGCLQPKEEFMEYSTNTPFYRPLNRGGTTMIRDITIKAVLNGYKVNVGCQEVVFTTLYDLLSNLEAYLRSPRTFEEAFLKNAINREYCYSNNPGGPVTDARTSLNTGRAMTLSDSSAACEQGEQVINRVARR